MKIAIVDSGIGGLSLLNRIIEKYQNIRIDYIYDDKNFPYGNKSKDKIEKAFQDLYSNFIMNKEYDCIFIACNTLSIVLGESIKTYKEKIFTMFDLINEVSKTNKKVSLLATDYTINSNAYNDYFEEIELIHGGDLAKKIEEETVNVEYIKELIGDVKYPILLACTHYIFAKESFPSNIELIDPTIYYERIIDIEEEDNNEVNFIASSGNTDHRKINIFLKKNKH